MVGVDPCIAAGSTGHGGCLAETEMFQRITTSWTVIWHDPTVLFCVVVTKKQGRALNGRKIEIWGNNDYGSDECQTMSESPAPNRVVSYYYRYIGDPDRTSDIYAGFGAFFLGLGLGIAGILIFLYSASQATPNYALREVAIVTGAVGAPALLIGIVILLPVDTRMLLVAGGGGSICAAGIVRFVAVYPNNFNVTANADYAAQVVGLYSVGLVLVIAATAAALIAHRVEQAGETAAAATGEGEADTESVTDEQVAADIDNALADTEVSWGGVETRETRRLKLDTSALDDVDRESLSESSVETRTTADGVDEAVAQLKGFQGGNVNTTSGGSTDEQAAALQELKQQQAQTGENELTLLDRLRKWLFS